MSRLAATIARPRSSSRSKSGPSAGSYASTPSIEPAWSRPCATRSSRSSLAASRAFRQPPGSSRPSPLEPTAESAEDAPESGPREQADLLFLLIAHGCDRRHIRIPSRPGGCPMTKASRVPVVGVLLIGVLCPPTRVSAQQRPAIADRISYEGKDKAGNPVKVTYTRSQLASQNAVVKDEVDPVFFNDQYWLLFPFHLVWDASAMVQDAGMQKLPLGKGSAKKVSVKYPSDGGYTPGDTWDLYVGTDGRIQELAFQHGGTAKPGVVLATWADYKKAGPLLLSLDHRGTADGKPFRLSFSNVAVKLTGSSTWVDAQ